MNIEVKQGEIVSQLAVNGMTNPADGSRVTQLKFITKDAQQYTFYLNRKAIVALIRYIKNLDRKAGLRA